MFDFVNCDVIVGDDFGVFVCACGLFFVWIYFCENSTLVFKFYRHWGIPPQNRGECSVLGGGGGYILSL